MEDRKFWFNYTYRRVKAMNRMLNFVVGARGIGKTFGFKEDAVEDYLKTGNQFVYMRRYDDEIKDRKCRDLFFPMKLREMYPDHEFKWYQGAYMIDGKVAGYPMVLSTAGQLKSVEYDRVTKVCFDEFIIAKQAYRYLPDEVTLFNEALVTVARMRMCQFWMMSNAISWNNPYFVRYRVPRPTAEITKTKVYTLTVPKSEKYLHEVENSPAGKLLKELDPEYFAYAFKNEVYDETTDFIEKKPGDCRYLCTISYNSVDIGIWRSPSRAKIYCSFNTDPTTPFKFALNKEDLRPGVTLLRKRGGLFDTVINAFRESALLYENLDVKATLYDIMRYIL